MSIWHSILSGAGAALAVGGPLGALVRAARNASGETREENPRRLRKRQVAFTVAAIALAAKMARADGYASQAEFATFQRLFHVPESERANAERFYRFAKGSTAGFESYATQAASLLGVGSPVLENLLEALMLIAATDGVVHPEELDYLNEVAERLGFDKASYARIRARYVTPPADDPYVVLGLQPGADKDAVRAAYRALVKQYHPDRHLAEGTPPEFIRVAEQRMAAINAAYRALVPRERLG
jgi:DnaJ like chaperone protein